MKRCALVFALFALALPMLAQQQPFQEQVDVNAVLLDVIVTDTKGNQILGLGKDDFIVKEDGVVQSLDSVDYFTNRKLLDQREENAPFKVERVREDRYFIFFLDKPQDAALFFNELQRVRRAGLEFLENEMQPTDYVAVVGHDVRLKVFSDFTNDKKQLEKAFADSIRFSNGVVKAAPGDGPSILRHIDATAMMNHTGAVYDALAVLGDALQPIRARKNLLLFSPGIVDRRETVRDGVITGRSLDFDAALQSLNASNVAVYSMQLMDDAPPTPAIHQRLAELADETGGHYFRFNTSFIPAVERVENTNSGYYLVSYTSKHAKGEKGFQKVEVRLKNPEFRIVARSGYEYGS